MHEYIIGKTGVGKSTHVENQLIAEHGGFTFLDPHGQSAEKIADTLPNIIYWEPFDATCPLAINVLEYVPEPQRRLVAEQIISAIKSVYPDNWGPNLEDILRNALYLLLDNSASLVQLPQVLTDSAYRTKLLRRCRNDAVRDFWTDEFPNRRNPEDEVRSTLNKVRIFRTDAVLNRTLSHNSVNLSRIINGGRRLIVNLSISHMGDKPAALLGALIINGIYQAAVARSVIPESDRVEHRLIVDEWQNFATTTFANILAEARKYRLFLTLINQLTAQIRDEALLKTVLGNAGRLTVFRVAYADAERLIDDLGLKQPEILVDLANFEYWERTGLSLRTAKTTPPPAARGYLAGNRTNTRARYRRVP